jgi:hypothetical protein
MPSPIWICKKNEIAGHIRRLFNHYGESPEYFDEYLNDVLKHDIDAALDCSRDLVRTIPYQKPMNKDVQNDARSTQFYNKSFAQAAVSGQDNVQ